MEIGFLLIYSAVAWYFLTQLQNKSGIAFFGSLSDYFIKKLIICFLFGWIIIPSALIILVLKKLLNTNK